MGPREVLKAQHGSERNQTARHEVIRHDAQTDSDFDHQGEGRGLVLETGSSGAPRRRRGRGWSSGGVCGHLAEPLPPPSTHVLARWSLGAGESRQASGSLRRERRRRPLQQKLKTVPSFNHSSFSLCQRPAVPRSLTHPLRAYSCPHTRGRTWKCAQRTRREPPVEGSVTWGPRPGLWPWPLPRKTALVGAESSHRNQPRIEVIPYRRSFVSGGSRGALETTDSKQAKQGRDVHGNTPGGYF